MRQNNGRRKYVRKEDKKKKKLYIPRENLGL